MGKRDGLIPIQTYLPESMLKDLQDRLDDLKKSRAVYLRDLVARDLKRAGVNTKGLSTMTQGRPRKEEEAK